MNDKTIAQITKVLLDVMFYLGILLCVTIPFTFRWLGQYYPNIADHYLVMCILFITTGILGIGILRELRRIFATVLAEDCFVWENVSSLKKMAYMGFGISLITACRLFFVLTPATIIIIGVFFIAGLGSSVLSQVFRQAVTYKQENDLTI
jgi:Protein of unknown function (DUF2975)